MWESHLNGGHVSVETTQISQKIVRFCTPSLMLAFADIEMSNGESASFLFFRGLWPKFTYWFFICFPFFVGADNYQFCTLSINDVPSLYRANIVKQ